MCNITAEKLDAMFDRAMNMPGNTEAEKTQRAVSVSNVKHWYSMIGMLWPALDSKQREIFNEAYDISKQIGIER